MEKKLSVMGSPPPAANKTNFKIQISDVVCEKREKTRTTRTTKKKKKKKKPAPPRRANAEVL